MLSIIVAIAENYAIGKDNKLLWHLPEDLKRFKELTTGHNIIMGRKTFESLGKVLPNRKHIVLTHNTDYRVADRNVEIVHSIEELQKYIDDENENFVIGGALIYRMLLDYCSKMYVTRVKKTFEGDAFFPKIDEAKWEEIAKVEGLKDEESGLEFEFVDYKKI